MQVAGPIHPPGPFYSSPPPTSRPSSSSSSSTSTLQPRSAPSNSSLRHIQDIRRSHSRPASLPPPPPITTTAPTTQQPSPPSTSPTRPFSFANLEDDDNEDDSTASSTTSHHDVDDPSPAHGISALPVSPHALRRWNALMEIVHTEAGYVHDLTALVNTYFVLLPSLSISAKALQVVNELTHAARAILALHERFLQKIQEATVKADSAGSPGVEEAVGKVAALFVKEAPAFDLYQQFCSIQPDALRLLKPAQARTEWETFEQICAKGGPILPPAPKQHQLEPSDVKSRVPRTHSFVPTSFRVYGPGTFFTEPMYQGGAGAASTSSAALLTHNVRSHSYDSGLPRVQFTPSSSPSPSRSLTSSALLGETNRRNTSLSFSSSSSSTSSSASRTKNNNHKLRFHDFLIKPIQRICKYPLMLEGLRMRHYTLPNSSATNVKSSSINDDKSNSTALVMSEREDRNTDHADAGISTMGTNVLVDHAVETMRAVAARVDEARRVKEAANMTRLILDRIDAVSASAAPSYVSGLSPAVPSSASTSSCSSCSSYSDSNNEPGTTMMTVTTPVPSPSPPSASPTVEFLASLGLCVLAGPLEVLYHHNHHESLQFVPLTTSSSTPNSSRFKKSSTSNNTLRARYLAAFLFTGGYVVLCKVSRRRGGENNGNKSQTPPPPVYKLKHWFSLAKFEVVDVGNEKSAAPVPLSHSFRLVFSGDTASAAAEGAASSSEGHRSRVIFDLAASSEGEKRVWMREMRAQREAGAVSRPNWRNEPVPSFHYWGVRPSEEERGGEGAEASSSLSSLELGRSEQQQQKKKDNVSVSSPRTMSASSRLGARLTSSLHRASSGRPVTPSGGASPLSPLPFLGLGSSSSRPASVASDISTSTTSSTTPQQSIVAGAPAVEDDGTIIFRKQNSHHHHHHHHNVAAQSQTQTQAHQPMSDSRFVLLVNRGTKSERERVERDVEDVMTDTIAAARAKEKMKSKMLQLRAQGSLGGGSGSGGGSINHGGAGTAGAGGVGDDEKKEREKEKERSAPVGAAKRHKRKSFSTGAVDVEHPRAWGESSPGTAGSNTNTTSLATGGGATVGAGAGAGAVLDRSPSESSLMKLKRSLVLSAQKNRLVKSKSTGRTRPVVSSSLLITPVSVVVSSPPPPSLLPLPYASSPVACGGEDGRDDSVLLGGAGAGAGVRGAGTGTEAGEFSLSGVGLAQEAAVAEETPINSFVSGSSESVRPPPPSHVALTQTAAPTSPGTSESGHRDCEGGSVGGGGGSPVALSRSLVGSVRGFVRRTTQKKKRNSLTTPLGSEAGCSSSTGYDWISSSSGRPKEESSDDLLVGVSPRPSVRACSSMPSSPSDGATFLPVLMHLRGIEEGGGRGSSSNSESVMEKRKEEEEGGSSTATVRRGESTRRRIRRMKSILFA